MPQAPLVFAPLTRWVLVWPDGSHVRASTQNGPKLFVTKADAMAFGKWSGGGSCKPVKVRVTIEVAQ